MARRRPACLAFAESRISRSATIEIRLVPVQEQWNRIVETGTIKRHNVAQEHATIIECRINYTTEFVDPLPYGIRVPETSYPILLAIYWTWMTQIFRQRRSLRSRCSTSSRFSSFAESNEFPLKTFLINLIVRMCIGS